MPFLGYAMTAWAVAAFASHPSGAIAGELNIRPEPAQLLLERKVSVRLQLWHPNSPIQTAQLANGGSVHIGMAHLYSHIQFGNLYDASYLTHIEEGDVVGIETTARMEIVNLRVRVGLEERLRPNVNGIRSGIPEEGKPAPPRW